MSARRRVLVTNGTTDAGAAAARSLTAAGFEVITTDLSRGLGVPSRFAAAHYRLKDDSQEGAATALLELTRRCRPDALLPLGTAAVYAVCRHRDELDAVTAVNVPMLEAFYAAYVKSVCVAECQTLGIPCPRSYSFDSAVTALESGQADVVVVKPDFDVGAAEGVRYARTVADLRAAVDGCTSRFGSVLIQEHIPGGADAMKTVVLVFAPPPHRRLAAAFTTRKIRHWPPTGGLTAASVSTSESALVDLMLPFFEKWQWCGAAAVELKFDMRDGLHKLIEINPRFPGYLRFAGHCGVDLPLVAVRLALRDIDSPAPLFSYEAGAAFVSPALYLRSVLFDLQQGLPVADTLRAARRELRGTGPLLKAMCVDAAPMIGRMVNDLLWPRDAAASLPDACHAAPPSSRSIA